MLDLIQVVGNYISGCHKTSRVLRLPPSMAAEVMKLCCLAKASPSVAACEEKKKKAARREETNGIWQCGKLRH